MHFNRLKPYRGDPEVRKTVRHKNRPWPFLKKIRTKYKPKRKAKTARSTFLHRQRQSLKLPKNKPKVTFREITEIVEQDFQSEIENASRNENNKHQILPHLTTYGKIPGDDSKNNESVQITVRNDELERLLDEDHVSQNELQQDSDVPTGRKTRVRRPPVRLGIDKFIVK